MHVSSITSPLSLDPNPNNWNWVLQILITAFVVVLGLLYLLRSTASKYFVVDANFDSSSTSEDMAVGNSNSNAVVDACANCGSPTSKQCAGCKRVKYCSQSCQSKHWRLEHRTKCQELKSLKHSGKHNMSVTSASSSGPDKRQKVVEKVLFPYDEFIKLYDWDKPIFPPCGLLNCGNSCYANVVLQCLAHTRPLLTYLLDKGHRRDCRRNGWCFLCELEIHLTRASRNPQPFSPLNILSRLPSIGSNLGYGKQEDAHEFMRFAIDTMQSICLDEHGGEKIIDPKSQETTLIQHIFGGQLRSQIICTKCNQVSNQYENMMDLTVEIQGDSTSLQECLDQFTAKEWLHGENMYKCDGCKDYVSAWKHLTIHQAPNVLTVALKRFQSGRFGKINKKISFPENLDLSPYMSEERDGMDKYKLYAIVVHVDMLNASFFGHYICYTKGFQGDWYRIDDCKVTRVELEEVLSQGAYMLLYRRICARPKCLKTFGTTINQQQNGEIMPIGAQHNCTIKLDKFSKPSSSNCSTAYLASDVNRPMDHPHTPAGHSRALGGSTTSTVASAKVPVADILGSSALGANALDSGTLTVATTELPVEVADVLGSSTFGVNASDNGSLTEANVEVPVEVGDVHGSCTLGANALDDVSCETFATSTNPQQNGETVSIGAKHSSTIQLDDSSKLSNSNHISADLASDVYRLLDNPHIPDVHVLRAIGDEFAFSNTHTVAGAEVPVEVVDTPRSSTLCVNELNDASRKGSEVMFDKEAVNVSVIGISGSPGKLVEHETEDVSHTTREAKSSALATSKQNGDSCERNDIKADYLGLGKNKNEVHSNDMDVESVELNEPYDQCNGVTDMLIDEFPTNTYLDMPPESDKPSFVHG